VIGRGAALSNTQGTRNESIDSLSGYREEYGKGARNGPKGVEETKDVTWGPRDSQGLLKYGKIKGIALKGTEL